MAKSTLDELTTFISIVDKGSIQKAADHLGINNATLSRTLQRLEKKHNVTLLERTTRKLNLTAEGQLFLAQAREIIQNLEIAEESLTKLDQDIAGTIRIDSATPFVLQILVPLVQEFHQRYPKISLEITSNDYNIDLLSEQTDIAIRFGELKDSSLHAKRLCRTRMVLVASPAYLAKQGIPTTAQDLRTHQTIGFTQKLANLNTLPVKINGEWLTITPTIRASSGETVRQLALAGNGIACLSLLVVQEDVAKGDLVLVLEYENQTQFQDIHAIYYQQGQLPRRMRVLMDFLAEKLEKDSV